MRRISAPSPWPARVKDAARQRLRELIEDERARARARIAVLQGRDRLISKDRVAHLLLGRWMRVAAVEGGLTGAMGFLGVPLNSVLVTYLELATVVSIAEAYEVELSGEQGEKAVLEVMGRVHGVDDLVRAGPRVVGALAKALALKHGLGNLGRLVPMLASPISAALNQRSVAKIGGAAIQRFGNVVLLG